jgi:hypothetical protein
MVTEAGEFFNQPRRWAVWRNRLRKKWVKVILSPQMIWGM